MPDGIVVLVRERVVVVAPIHPVPQADGLFDHAPGECENALFAALYKFGDAEGFDIELSFEAKFLLNLDLNP